MDIKVDIAKKYSKIGDIPLQWVLVAFLEEAIVSELAESDVAKDCVIKGDYIQFGGINKLLPYMPTLEIVFNRNEPREVLNKVENLNSDNIQIVKIREAGSIERYPWIEGNYYIQARVEKLNVSFAMKILYYCKSDVSKEVLKNSIYYIAASAGVKEINGYTKMNPSVDMRSINIEGLIVEKLERIWTMGELLDNMKDYYDILYICSYYCLDGRRIREYISDIGLDRHGLVNIKEQFDNKNLGRRWGAYIKDKDLQKISFGSLISSIERVFDPIIKAMENEEEFFGTWMPELGRYID